MTIASPKIRIFNESFVVGQYEIGTLIMINWSNVFVCVYLCTEPGRCVFEFLCPLPQPIRKEFFADVIGIGSGQTMKSLHTPQFNVESNQFRVVLCCVLVNISGKQSHLAYRVNCFRVLSSNGILAHRARRCCRQIESMNRYSTNDTVCFCHFIFCNDKTIT